jgi:hypothetical protein
VEHSLRTHKPVALSVAATAGKSKSKLGAGLVAFDFAALRSGRTGKAPQQVRKCTNLSWSDLVGKMQQGSLPIPHLGEQPRERFFLSPAFFPGSNGSAVVRHKCIPFGAYFAQTWRPYPHIGGVLCENLARTALSTRRYLGWRGC